MKSVKVIGFEIASALYDKKKLYRNIFVEAQNTIQKIDISFDDFYFMLRGQSNIEYEAFLGKKERGI